MRFIKLAMFCILVLSSVAAKAQDVTGSIIGKVYDDVTGEPLEMATVAVGNQSAVTDLDGIFEITGLPVGRHTIKVVYLGYEPCVKRDVSLGSGHALVIDLPMRRNANELAEVVVNFDNNAGNTMAIAGGHKLDMTEATNYAGSLDDPGRLASTVAGTSADVSHNGLSIHGIAPHLMQWRLEGVEIPNPNHYADIATLGGGILTSLSSFVLGNSDFYAGAAPAQYVNALSGVFDMHMRAGNSRNYQHAVQAGVLGIDLASEGPISRNAGSSYIVNYRYSATGLLENLGLMDAGGSFNYQDLNFKVNLPSRRIGDFSIWGTMLIDKFKDTPDDPAEWLYVDDGTISSTKQYMIAGGVSHRIQLGNGRLSSTLAYTFSDNSADMHMARADKKEFSPYIDADKRQTGLIATTNWLSQLTPAWKMNVGATFTEKIYNLRLRKAPLIGEPMMPVTNGDGNAALVEAYTDNVVRLGSDVQLGAGLNLMYLSINNATAVQPRLSLKWNATGRLSFSAASGLYSRMENMDVYYTSIVVGDGADANRDLGFTKSMHSAVAATYRIAQHLTLSASPFVNYLYDVPSGEDDSYSILNLTDFYITRKLTNAGKGLSYGIDLTVERSLDKGWYGNFTASLFSSRYCGGDGVWHNTRFDRNYIFNVLGGKEWKVGSRRNNMLNVNGRITLQGGERYSPYNAGATEAHPDHEVQYDETRAYSMQHKPMFFFSFSVSYRINRKHLSHVFALDMLNAGGYNEPYGHAYNLLTGGIDVLRQKTSLPNLYYRLEF